MIDSINRKTAKLQELRRMRATPKRKQQQSQGDGYHVGGPHMESSFEKAVILV